MLLPLDGFSYISMEVLSREVQADRDADRGWALLWVLNYVGH